MILTINCRTVTGYIVLSWKLTKKLLLVCAQSVIPHFCDALTTLTDLHHHQTLCYGDNLFFIIHCFLSHAYWLKTVPDFTLEHTFSLCNTLVCLPQCSCAGFLCEVISEISCQGKSIKPITNENPCLSIFCHLMPIEISSACSGDRASGFSG